MALVLTRDTDATTEPVTLAQMKAHLRFTWNNEDDLIATLITACRRHLEDYAGRAFITQTWTLKLDSFPCVIEVPRPPFIGITSFTYIDTNGDSQTVDSSLYTADSSSEPGRIFEAYNQQWPTTRCQRNAVTLTYTAGYGSSADDVPAEFKAAIKLFVAHLFKHREQVLTGGSPVEIPLGIKDLISMHQVFVGA